jgi:hypothetical protein
MHVCIQTHTWTIDRQEGKIALARERGASKALLLLRLKLSIITLLSIAWRTLEQADKEQPGWL